MGFSCVIAGEGSLPIRCLEHLVERGHRVKALASHCPLVMEAARARQVTVVAPVEEALRDLLPFDHLFSIVNNDPLSDAIRALPSGLAIHFHDSHLPRYAGFFSTSWALINRERSHGVSWTIMAGLRDGGDVLTQAIVEIGPSDSAFDLNVKCYEACLRSFHTLVTELTNGTVAAEPQDLELRTFFPLHQRPSGVLRWDHPANELDALVRALDFGPRPRPLGCPKIALEESVLLAGRTRLTSKPSTAPPSTIVEVAGADLVMATATEDLVLSQLRTCDGAPLSPADLNRRYGLVAGGRLPILTDREVDGLAARFSARAPAEAFWVDRLTTASPLSLSGAATSTERCSAPMSQALSGAPAPLLDASAGVPGAEVAAALVLAFLSRVSQTWQFDVGLHRPEHAQEAPRGLPFFQSDVPLRVDIPEGASFWEHLDRFRRELALIGDQGTYARDLVARSPRTEPTTALPVTLSLDTPCPRPCFGGVAVAVSTDGSAISCRYDSAAISADTLAALASSFGVFGKHVADDPSRSLASLPLVDAVGERALIDELSGLRSPLQGARVDELVALQAGTTPSRTAVSDGRARLSFRELDERVNQLAHHLRGRFELGADDIVGIYLPRSIEMVVAALAIQRAGGAFLPIDRSAPPTRIARILERAAALGVIAGASTAARLPRELSVLDITAERRAIAERPRSAPPPASGPDNLAYVIFTSGSTGEPKGVMIPHRALHNHMQWMLREYPLTEGDVVLQRTPLSFDAAVWEVYAPLMTGARLLLAPPDTEADIPQLMEVILQGGVTIFQVVPSLLRLLVGSDRLDECLTLRRVFSGGEPLPTALARRFIERSKAELINLYGPTEACIDATHMRCTPEVLAVGGEIVPIGAPIDNTRLVVLDRHGHLLPRGARGELAVGGLGLAHGYIRRPDLTQQRFIRRAFAGETDDTWYLTGDLVRLDDHGRLHFLGRVDNQVKVRGVRIELEEIDAALERHPDVSQAATVVQERAAGDQRLISYYTGAEELLRADLVGCLSTHLPHTMIPNHFAWLRSLPRLPNGKLDRGALPPFSSWERSEPVASLTSLEEVIATVWREVLGVDRVGRDDNFFDLGGHSLLLEEVRRRLLPLDEGLSIVRLFELPTIATLANYLGGHHEADEPVDAGRRRAEMRRTRRRKRRHDTRGENSTSGSSP